MAREPNAPVAIITGAAKRLGKAIAQRLHADGMRCAIHYRSSSTDAQSLVDALNEGRSQSAMAVQADLGDADALRKMINAVTSTFGGIDILVNNASSFFPTPIGEVSDSDWSGLFDSNARGPLLLSQAAAVHLRQRSGAIINIIDIHAERPMREHTVYCMAKAALLMMTKSLALELAPHVRVNGVSPGAILWPTADPGEEEKQRTLARVPMARVGEPKDIADAVAYLALHANYVTGQILRVDGGRTLNM